MDDFIEKKKQKFIKELCNDHDPVLGPRLLRGVDVEDILDFLSQALREQREELLKKENTVEGDYEYDVMGVDVIYFQPSNTIVVNHSDIKIDNPMKHVGEAMAKGFEIYKAIPLVSDTFAKVVYILRRKIKLPSQKEQEDRKEQK